MILASHVILSCYGFWLPNEERGSWSDFVRKYELYREFGPATKVETRASVANQPYNPALRAAAKRSLRYPPVYFTGKQAQLVALAFGNTARRFGYQILAFSILRNHGHIVLGRHRYPVEQVVNLLKGAATKALLDAGMHSLAHHALPDGSVPSMWSEGIWKVFLDSDEDVWRAIRYVNDNPLKEGKRRQRWSFVVPWQSRS